MKGYREPCAVQLSERDANTMRLALANYRVLRPENKLQKEAFEVSEKLLSQFREARQ
jgi:hypothetical protein